MQKKILLFIIIFILLILIFVNHKRIIAWMKYRANLHKNNAEIQENMSSRKSRNINDVVPNGSVIKNDYTNHYEVDVENDEQDMDECDVIDNYRNNFFSFNTRINNPSNINDPVDMINLTNNGQAYPVGMKISDIFDNLTKNKYKTANVNKCVLGNRNL